MLAHILTLLNERHAYGLDLLLLSVDEGITGYRDDSLETVKRNEQQYSVPLTIVSYKQLYGWTMDEIVKQIGHKNNCTFCGVFRRQALDRGAILCKASKIATGESATPQAPQLYNARNSRLVHVDPPLPPSSLSLEVKVSFTLIYFWFVPAR